MVTPTNTGIKVGAQVTFIPLREDAIPASPGEPLTATVAKIHGRTSVGLLVNLAVCDANGNWHSRTGVPLLPIGAVGPGVGGYCTLPVGAGGMTAGIGMGAGTGGLGEAAAA